MSPDQMVESKRVRTASVLEAVLPRDDDPVSESIAETLNRHRHPNKEGMLWKLSIFGPMDMWLVHHDDGGKGYYLPHELELI